MALSAGAIRPYAESPAWLPWRPLRDLWRSPLDFFARLAREQGDFAKVRLGWTDLYLVNQPGLVWELLSVHHRSLAKGRPLRKARLLLGEGLLTSEGELHARQRRVMRPAFHHARVAGFTDTMAASALDAQAAWHDGETVEISSEMMRLTQRIVARTLFATDIEPAEAVRASRALDTLVGGFGLVLLPFSAVLLRLPLPAARRIRRAKAELERTISAMIATRRATGDRGDLLSMLLFATDENGRATVSEELVRDEAMTVFLAGHDTTGNGLAWSWHLLAHHPEQEAHWHDELDAVLGGRQPTFSDVPDLPFTRNIFTEALRLYPPAPAVGRQALEDIELGGHAIRKGSVIQVCQWLLHRDPRFFPEPDRFRPERWTPQMEAELPRGCYLPFGIGPRYCVGRELAGLIGTVALATLGQRWRLRATTGPIVETVARSITLRPRHGLPMRLERRGREL